MITYLVGNPGSGKTYYAVFEIYRLFLFKPQKTFLGKFIKQPKPKEYNYCYTNINEFKFDLHEKFIKFDFDKFYSDMSILYDLYVSKIDDAVLNERAKELNLSGCLIILDEAHNFLKAKGDPVLIWWVTYHRHLYQDIYFITQDLSLINDEYKRIAEYFLKAVDSAKRLFKNKFRYIKYSGYKLYKKDVLEALTIPYLKEVFDLYHSGQDSSQKSFVRQYIYLGLFIFIVLLIVFYFFVQQFKPDVSETRSDLESPGAQLSGSNLESRSAHQTKPTPQVKDKPSQTYIYDISCIDDVCNFKNEKYTFPYGFISHAISGSKPLYFYSTTKSKYMTEYFIVLGSDVIEPLKQISNSYKGAVNEKSSKDISGPSPSIFK